VQAIHQGLGIDITYQSLTRPQPTQRTVSPHALAHDGFRWHVRAYCHSRGEFRDFVLARIVAIGAFGKAAAHSNEDADWATLVVLRLAPHPKLPQGHRNAIELDYGMKGGQVEFKCRRAFLFYALRHLRLDEGVNDRSPQEQQIVLLNQEEVFQALQGAGRRSS
jgi:predicted DNA-binding transcriptional regulator YafY